MTPFPTLTTELMLTGLRAVLLIVVIWKFVMFDGPLSKYTGPRRCGLFIVGVGLTGSFFFPWQGTIFYYWIATIYVGMIVLVGTLGRRAPL